MQSLVIYDDSGRILNSITGDYSRPTGGVSFLEIVIPAGKMLSGVDLSGDEPVPIFEDLPISDNERLRREMAQMSNELIDLIMMMGGN